MQVLNKESLLLREVATPLGLYSTQFGCIRLPVSDPPQSSDEDSLSIIHEKVHWVQHHTSPWGFFVMSLLDVYVNLSEAVLQIYYSHYGCLRKPVALFIAIGTSTEEHRDLEQAVAAHERACEALVLQL